jgi:hypothetical protein
VGGSVGRSTLPPTGRATCRSSRPRSGLIDAASFCVVAAAALSLHARAGRPAFAKRGGRARAGIAHLIQDRVVRIVMVAAFASLLFMTASAAAEVFFAKDVMHLSDAGFGAWMSAWPIGMVLGALVVARRLRVDLAAGALVAIVLQGVGLALPTVWIAIGLAFAGSWPAASPTGRRTC